MKLKLIANIILDSEQKVKLILDFFSEHGCEVLKERFEDEPEYEIWCGDWLCFGLTLSGCFSVGFNGDPDELSLMTSQLISQIEDFVKELNIMKEENQIIKILNEIWPMADTISQEGQAGKFRIDRDERMGIE